MSAKNEYLREVLPRYLQADKHEKTNILDEVCAVTGYHRKYVITKLWLMQRRSPAELEDKQRRSRGRIYGNECLPALKNVWEFLENPCCKRLVPYLPEIMPKLEAASELVVSSDVRRKLHTISAATVDPPALSRHVVSLSNPSKGMCHSLFRARLKFEMDRIGQCH